MRHRIVATAACLGIVGLLAGGKLQAAETFIKSDDYKEKEEAVGKFLTDPEYTLMVSDLQRNDAEFDWGWVKTPDGKLKKIKVLGFDLATYKTVRIPAVQDFTDSLDPALATKVHDAFERAATALGLQVVAADAKDAGLELGVAIVGLKRERTYAYVAMIDPFIKLEVRLKAVEGGEDLLLLRNRSHSETPESASIRFASQMMKFLK
jgi:hypothetical protein